MMCLRANSCPNCWSRDSCQIEDYFKREVLPHVPDAWIDHTKTKIGYETE
jgi:hypothetical protein